MKATESELQRIVSGACLIVAPLLMLTGNILRFTLDNVHLWHPALNIIAVALYVPAILETSVALSRAAHRGLRWQSGNNLGGDTNIKHCDS